jgi:hypothetical protein
LKTWASKREERTSNSSRNLRVRSRRSLTIIIRRKVSETIANTKKVKKKLTQQLKKSFKFFKLKDLKRDGETLNCLKSSRVIWRKSFLITNPKHRGSKSSYTTKNCNKRT